jgi:Ca-activated chloride channel family protein
MYYERLRIAPSPAFIVANDLEKIAMNFGAPQWFWALLALPALLAIFVRGERRGSRRLREFVSPRLLPQLAATMDPSRRIFRLSLQLLGLACVIVSLAQPRWGYTFEDVKRKGLDLLIAVDTSRSMLSNDVQPDRLDRVKLAAQDLINQLQGDRVGLIAFAGRAFVQAPLTSDYDAAIESINDLDTKTIPEGGTNISEAIALTTTTFGKSALGNRALIIFTDGEELSGDAVKAAKAAADAGVRIFTVGVGTQQGSLIPVPGEDGGTAFVKDSKGEVVKSRLDENRLRDIAQATGGLYFHLEAGPRTMSQLYTDGLAKMTAAEMDVRLSKRPIERYEWPLGMGSLLLAISILISDRKRMRAPLRLPRLATTAAPVTALLIFSACPIWASVPGMDAYRQGKFDDAYAEFQQTLKEHPNSRAEDRLQFDSGAAAYKRKDYGTALESFSQALLSSDPALQTKSHYNLGNTLYQRGENQQADDKKLTDWTNALQHYEQSLKLDPQDKDAKENYDYVKKKIEELKNKQQQRPPQSQQQQKNQQKPQDQQDKEQSQQQQQQSQQQEQQQSQSQSNQQNQQQPDKNQSQAKNERQQNQQANPNETPSSSGKDQRQQNQSSPSPGEQKQKSEQSNAGRQEESPTPGGETPSPSPGEGADETEVPSPSPTESPQKKLAGDIKEAQGDKSQEPQKQAQIAQAESEKEGQMSERQAEELLQSMKDEEARVQLDERRQTRRVYKDW